MDKTKEKMASYAASTSYADLTPEAIHAVKRSMVDSVGCAFGAFHAEPVKAVRALASQVTSTRPATLIGTDIRSSAELAALANGFMIRYLDFSDDYFGGDGKDSGPHPSDNIGGVLAAAESAGADGKTLVLGITVAYEACGQLVDILHLRPQGWDYPILHSIATSLGAAKVLGLSQEQTGHALALAVVPNICLRQARWGELSQWKGCAGPNGSRCGLFAALLAKEGITGPPMPFEGKAGFMEQLAGPFELGNFGGKGIPFKIEGTFFKYLSVMYTIQLPIWTALELRNKVKIEDIESIRVYLDEHSMVGGAYSAERWDPKTRETADHSGPYLIGAALVDGEITAKTFTPERFRDPTILNLIKKISAEEDKEYTATFPHTFNCRFEVSLHSGETFTLHKTNPKGHPANPLSDQDIEDKFLKLVDPFFTKQQSRTLLDQLWNLEKLDDLSKLFHLMLAQTRD